MINWDDNKTPMRRFNPLPFKLIVIGAIVFLVISLSRLIF